MLPISLSVGSINYCEKDREEIGYTGRKEETVSDTIIFKNKRKIKQGEKVTTILYPIFA